MQKKCSDKRKKPININLLRNACSDPTSTGEYRMVKRRIMTNSSYRSYREMEVKVHG